MVSKALLTSHKQTWKTPFDLMKSLEVEFMFDFDPAPVNPNFDGLKVEWGSCNYINPPYTTKLQDAFVKKAYEESLKGKTCVMLLPARTGTKRFHEIILPYAKEIRFLKGRLCFDDKGKRAPFDSMIVIFQSKKKR